MAEARYQYYIILRESLQGERILLPFSLFPLSYVLTRDWDSSIRLLDLDYMKLVLEVRCRLRVVDVRYVHSYNTLSYAWKPADREGRHSSSNIVCNGRPTEIAASLHVGLRRIRDILRMQWGELFSSERSETPTATFGAELPLKLLVISKSYCVSFNACHRLNPTASYLQYHSRT